MDPLLVITGAADTVDHDSLDVALRVLRAETSVEVQEAGYAGELDGVLHRAGSRPIVVAGGDSDLHAVVSCLHRRHDLDHAVLGLLPLGRDNDFAVGNGIPLDPRAAAGVLLAGVVRPRDLLVDEVGEIVTDSVHAGPADDEPTGHGGGWGGWRRVVEAIGPDRPTGVHLRVEVDGEVVADFDRPVLGVGVGNGSILADGVQLAPGAVPGDGLLDVLVSWAPPLGRIGYAASRLLRGERTRHEVIHLRGRTVSVSGEAFWCSADGEVYGPERHRSWRIEPAAYSMLVPA